MEDSFDTTTRLAVDALEAARMIGVSERTIRTLTKEQQIPFVRVRGRVLYPIAALEAWLRDQTEQSE